MWRFIPRPDDRPDHPDMIRYNGIWPDAEELDKTSGGFQISRNQYDLLKYLMKQGTVRVHGKIDATLGPGKLTLVHAYIRGTEHPEREILITGHLDHPKWSANDNASGSGAMMEGARALQTLIADEKARAAEDYYSLHVGAGIFRHSGLRQQSSRSAPLRSAWDDPRNKPMLRSGKPCIVANINMDMVGEDTVKTNSRFYFTKLPDSVPSFLDGLLADVLEQTREADLYAPNRHTQLLAAGSNPLRPRQRPRCLSRPGVPSTMLATILIGPITPAKTRSTRQMRANFGEWELWPAQPHI